MKEEQGCQSPGDKGVNRMEEFAERLEHTVPGRAIGDFVFVLKKWKGPRCFKHSTDFFFFPPKFPAVDGEVIFGG